MIIKTANAHQTQEAGEEFAHKIQSGGVVCLSGHLGAGKTTFTQGVARGLGINQNIISPTFILMRRYQLPVTSHQQLATKYLCHIDLYRLDSIDEVKGLGIEEILADSDNIVLIEWPEKIAPLLPRRRWEVQLETLSENSRKITFSDTQFNNKH